MIRIGLGGVKKQAAGRTTGDYGSDAGPVQKMPDNANPVPPTQKGSKMLYGRVPMILILSPT